MTPPQYQSNFITLRVFKKQSFNISITQGFYKMIDVKNFVAVGGKSGVLKLIAVRSNGLIVEDFDTKKREFTPVRQNQFSPFETISVYTDVDTVTLAEVLTTMKKQAEEGNMPPSEKSASNELRDYFTGIVPTHDRERVHMSDIKKIIKWYNFLSSRDLLKEKAEEKVEEQAEEKVEEATSESKEA